MIKIKDETMEICAICNKSKKTITRQPSRSQLIFGGFPVRYENRCQACETKLVKQLERNFKMIKNS